MFNVTFEIEEFAVSQNGEELFFAVWGEEIMEWVTVEPPCAHLPLSIQRERHVGWRGVSVVAWTEDERGWSERPLKGDEVTAWLESHAPALIERLAEDREAEAEAYFDAPF